MNVGKVIRGYRESEKISVRDLAAKIGVEHTLLWRFENGKQIRTSVWVKIIKWLLCEDEDAIK